MYPTLVRLAQPFNMRYPLVDGQGNFGSVDGDPPAAMRYTEARLTPLAMEMLADLEMDTVDMVPNYDATREEPFTLPGRFPNLLCNGASGIAVGMATNMPPHNLGEVIDALHYLIENPDAEFEDLLQFIKGPDFPTGGLVMGFDKDREGLVVNNIKHAYATGRGRILIRARVEFEETHNGRTQIIVTELPYQVNKATLQERIAELVRDKKLDGIAAMQDESDRKGMRLVIETKRDANPHTVLNHLYKHTAMQQAFSYNMLALVDGQPQLLPLKRLLIEFLDYRQQVLTRRTTFELAKARQRAHILEGLVIALDNLDAVIRTIRGGGQSRGVAAAAHAELRAQRSPGAGHPRDAARSAGQPRAATHPGRVRGDQKARRLPGRPAGQPDQDHPPGARRADRAEEEVWRSAPHRDRHRLRRRDQRRRPGRQRKGPDHHQRQQLREAHAGHHVPRPAARRARHHRPGAARRGCAAAHHRRERARQHSVLQRQGQGLSAAGLAGAELRSHRPRHAGHQRGQHRVRARRSPRSWPRQTSKTATF